MIRIIALCVAATLATLLAVTSVTAESHYFARDTLNAGLGKAPDRIDRTTPRATVESLILMAEAGDWTSAAHLLDLDAIPQDLQPRQGTELAAMLKSVLDRKVVLDWDQLVDRPDGLDVMQSSSAATAGMPRRSLLIWELNARDLPASIRLDRIKPADGDPVWVFSRRTVVKIQPLFSEYGPSQFEKYLPERLRKEAIWGVMWWELFGLPLLVALAALVGWSVRRGVSLIYRNVSTQILSSVIRAAATPIVIAAVTTVIMWGTSTVFVFSGRLDAILSPLVAIGFVTALLMLIVKTMEELLDHFVGFDNVDLTSRQEAENRDKATKVAAIRRVLVLAVFLIGVGVVLSSANVFRSLGFSILASAGALTLVLGFAARKVLGNIMASLQIAMNQSARVGDRVVYKDHLCHVERINFTYVQLRDWDGIRLVVPVEEFVSETFQNWTLKEPEMLRILKFKLDPRVDVDALREAFEDILDTLDAEQLDDRDKASVKVTGQDALGIEVWFAVPCVDPNTSWDIACEAREKLVRRMSEMENDSNVVFPDATPAEAA